MKKLLLLIFIPFVLLAQNPQAQRFQKGLKTDSVFSLNGLSILFRVEPERNVLGLWDDSTVVYTGNTRTAWFNSSGLNVLTALYVNGNIVKSMAHADSGRYSTHISNSKSMSYSDSTWWWNKRDTASVPGVPTINRMLDSLADIRTSISAAGVTSVTGSLGVIALPTTGATKIRLDKLNIDTVGTLIKGAIGAGFTSIATTYTDAKLTSITGSNGIIALPATGAPNVRLNKTAIDSVGTVTTGVWQGTAITDTYLATISTAGKVSGAAITSGTIAGTTIFGGASVNVSGTIAGYGLISGGGGGAGNLSLYNAAGYKNIIVAGATPTSADQTFTFPALTGTIITTSNLSSITTVGTVATGVWQGTSITTAYTDAKITSITGSLGVIALPTTGATKIRLDKLNIDTVGTLTWGAIDWAGLIQTSAPQPEAGSLTTKGQYSSQTIRFKQSAGQETNAGSISYNEISAGYLDIIGMGTTNVNRLVYLFDCVGIGSVAPSTSYGLSAASANITAGGYYEGGAQKYLPSAYGTKTAFSPAEYIVEADGTPVTQVYKRTITINGVTVNILVTD